MESTQGSHIQGERVAFGRLLWAGPLAAVAAAVANAIVYFIASALGAMPQNVFVEGSGPITLEPVVLASVIGAVGLWWSSRSLLSWRGGDRSRPSTSWRPWRWYSPSTRRSPFPKRPLLWLRRCS
jgi:hypothetical protein